MTRPHKVRVGPFVYAVKYLHGLRTETAWVDSERRVIYVSDSQDLQSQAESLVHEVFHTLVDLTSMRAGAIEDGVKEEAMVASLSPLWFSVLRDNPALVRFVEATR